MKMVFSTLTLGLLLVSLGIPGQLSYAQEDSPKIALVPQETYGDAVLDLLERKGEDGVTILQFNFFTDNTPNTYPKRIAAKLVDIRQRNPKAPIVIALEGRKDANKPDGKGAAQRNAKTKLLLAEAGIEVHDVHGHSESGVTHTKLVLAGDEIIAGSSNLTMQSTNIGANNEMNVSVRSRKMADAVRDYVSRVIANPGQMADIEAEEGPLRLLTDRLHFSELVRQIALAQKGDQLGLSMYQFLYRTEEDKQAKQVLEELIAAHKRGVQIEVFLNRAESLGDQNTAANLRVAEILMQEGISNVYFDPGPKISHSKFLYRISGNGNPPVKTALVSSVNIYGGDFNNNHQLTWVVTDVPFVDQLVSYFKQQIAYDGLLVSRIAKDPQTGLRYQNLNNGADGESTQTEWNKVLPAKRMLRFWRGYKQDGVSISTFQANVNARLIPETIAVGGGRGLRAYLPSFFPESDVDFLPDEIAIVDYADKEVYNAIRTTERGSQYGPLHFSEGLFAVQNSKGLKSGSLVASVFEGAVEVKPEGRAYILGASDIDWQGGVTLRRTLLPVGDNFTSDVQQFVFKLAEMSEVLGMRGAVVVVDPRYVIVMANMIDQTSAANLDADLQSIERDKFRKADHIIFAEQEYGSTHLKPGSGISVKFDPEIKVREHEDQKQSSAACKDLAKATVKLDE